MGRLVIMIFITFTKYIHDDMAINGYLLVSLIIPTVATPNQRLWELVSTDQGKPHPLYKSPWQPEHVITLFISYMCIVLLNSLMQLSLFTYGEGNLLPRRRRSELWVWFD